MGILLRPVQLHSLVQALEMFKPDALSRLFGISGGGGVYYRDTIVPRKMVVGSLS